MSRVVLFHSVQGLRPAVLQGAERLRAAGHEVRTPELYGDGRTFDSIEAALPSRDEIGIPDLMERAQAAVADLPADVVYAGFSMGAAAAEYLALTRPGARGLVLVHGAVPPAAIGVERWPGDLPVALHHAQDDPWVSAEEREPLLDAAGLAGAEVESFAYPGSGHLFDDPGMPEFDPASAELLWERVIACLARW